MSSKFIEKVSLTCYPILISVCSASRGEEPNAELLDKYREAFEKTLEGYERILAKQKYLAGNVGHSPLSQ